MPAVSAFVELEYTILWTFFPMNIMDVYTIEDTFEVTLKETGEVDVAV